MALRKGAHKNPKTKATGRKPKPQDIKKGEKRALGVKGRKGRPHYDREERLAVRVDKGLVTRYLSLNSHLTLSELKEKIKLNSGISALENMVIRGMIRACNTGDSFQIGFYLDRLVGKVPNKVEHSVPDPFEGMTNDQLLEEKRKLETINRKTMSFIEGTEHVINLENKVKQLADATESPNGETTPKPD